MGRHQHLEIANNRNLSFILLISLMFSLLSVFFFIGRPVDITCMLRQIFYGVFFTVAVSSVLAKTIIVCIAFKATRPDSPWRKCVGVKLPYTVVLVCSSIQILNAVIWLSLSPPYQEYNLDYPGKIIIQCNEGSVLAFYLMLGYMGFLAAVSFVLAFLVRTLPDIYNEAKYITFSMLVFCSVWICAIPAYLSSTGKHMVTVEIFAILASGGGILGWFPMQKLKVLQHTSPNFGGLCFMDFCFWCWDVNTEGNIGIEIPAFWQINKGSAPIPIIWDALKAFIRGLLFKEIQITKRKFRAREKELEDRIGKLQSDFYGDSSQENFQLLIEAEEQYSIFTQEKAQQKIFFQNYRFFIEGGKPNKMLADIVKAQDPRGAIEEIQISQ
ncbi:vomeronasal type-2 receptor 26-like [Dendropsophus ebraccatus]|uniref:vomeronasal type-2 receptor 26-like n=1 Tax=Dendropsophus ebraccatus TaxID=150705 RepID=UPI0038322DE0